MKFVLLGACCFFYHAVLSEAGPTGTGNVKSLKRILGGDTVNIRNYPYQISMRMYNGMQYKHFCGGSIIDNLHIVTAAHCVYKKLNQLGDIKIFTGTSRSDFGGIGHSIKSVKVHPEYTGGSTFFFNDIAVVTLYAPIQFNYETQPINLPTRNIQNWATATITGWGDTSLNSETPIHLQKASMYLLESSQCQRQLPYPLKNTQVCVNTRRGYGVCSGDSGGPLVANNQLVGVASYVTECGSGKPEVFTNVYPFVDFIKRIISSGDSSMPSVGIPGNQHLTQPFNPFGNQHLTQPSNPFGNQHPVLSFNQFGIQQFGQPLNPYGQQPFGYGK